MIKTFMRGLLGLFVLVFTVHLVIAIVGVNPLVVKILIAAGVLIFLHLLGSYIGRLMGDE